MSIIRNDIPYPDPPILLNNSQVARLILAVDTGGLYLDSADESWYTKINPDTLRMRHAEECILGQLGDVLSGLNTPKVSYTNLVGATQPRDAVVRWLDGCTSPNLAAALVMSYAESRERGFTLGGDIHESAWSYLNKLWTREVLRRI